MCKYNGKKTNTPTKRNTIGTGSRVVTYLRHPCPKERHKGYSTPFGRHEVVIYKIDM